VATPRDRQDRRPHARKHCESLLAIVAHFNEAGGEPPADADVLGGMDWL
jgi:hypothetical protein